MDNQRIDFTPEVIAQQRAICDAATPGPWEMTESEGFCDHVGKACPYGKPCEDSGCDDCDDWTWTQGAFLETGKTIYCGDYEGNIDADIRFCVSARTVLPAALDALEASMQREAEKDAIIARVTAERDAAVCDMFGCMSTQGQCVRCKKRYCCDGTDDDKFSPLCKNNSHCYAWEWRGLHADNTDAPAGAESGGVE